MENEELRQRLRAVAAAMRPVEEWIAGAHALALLHGALQAGILDAFRTPRSVAAVAEICGIDPGRTADVCAALEAHDVLRRDGESYCLAEEFAVLMSPEPLLPLARVAARAVATAHLFEMLPGALPTYNALSQAERLACAQDDSVDPASPLRPMLSFLDLPELRHVYD
jgi:hypothetical protein